MLLHNDQQREQQARHYLNSSSTRRWNRLAYAINQLVPIVAFIAGISMKARLAITIVANKLAFAFN